MAAKNSKAPNYSEIAALFSGVPAGKTLIDLDKLDELLEDKKRIQVITMDTMLDDLFKKILLFSLFSQRNKNVLKLFEPSIGGPLVSLTHKARLAYALGLIDETTLKDLEFIHKIRNEFAHSTEMNFADAKVLKFLEKLSNSKGQKVTPGNSYDFYENALRAIIKEIARQIMLWGAKKKPKKD